MSHNENMSSIRVAIVGIGNSGKSAVTEHLIALATEQNKPLEFTEIHNLDNLHDHQYDVVLQVIDCTRLEESMMLIPHVVDENEKIVLAFNRYDLLLKTKHELNLEQLRRLIGVPLEIVNGNDGIGIESLLNKLIQTAGKPSSTASPVYHAWEQKDEEAYLGYVHGVLVETLIHAPNDKHTGLELIDKILTNKWLGFPFLLLVLAVVFEITFALGTPLQDGLQVGIDALYNWIMNTLPGGWFASLIGDGVIMGVGALLTALPNIIILFFFLSVMEDSGYMARVSFIMDGIMHRIGLHGRSFIPMLMGFDCNVPAIMAAKDIHNPKDRALTMLMIPFMSCSARLPVYILFISTFFEKHKALVLLSLYALGILLSFVFALIMKRTKWFKHEDTEVVNELPRFQMPSLQSVVRHIWYRVEDFLKKISTVVLFASVIIWALEFFPNGNLDNIETSWLAAIGKFTEPLVRPLGFDWKMAICLLTGLPAKEAIASTLAILYGGDITASAFTPVSAYAFLIFTLLYFPCVATISTLRRELNWKWATFEVVNSLLLAWLMAFIVYQIGIIL